MTIENIPIGSHVRQTIEAYAKMKSFPHTVLLDGADAKSRRELALFLAQTILCTGDARPCGSCNACIKCKAGVHPDIKEFGEIGSNAVFKIDAAREIKQDAFILPNDGDRKVYILLETQQMNDNAANALLKTLEEPPRYAHFILTATAAPLCCKPFFPAQRCSVCPSLRRKERARRRAWRPIWRGL